MDDPENTPRWGTRPKRAGKKPFQARVVSPSQSQQSFRVAAAAAAAVDTPPPATSPAPEKASASAAHATRSNGAFRKGMPWVLVMLGVAIGATLATPAAYSVPYVSAMAAAAAALPPLLYFLRASILPAGGVLVVWSWATAASVANLLHGTLGSTAGPLAGFTILGVIALFLIIDDWVAGPVHLERHPLRALLTGAIAFMLATLLVFFVVAPLSLVGLVVVLVAVVCVVQIVHWNARALRKATVEELATGPWTAFRFVFNAVLVWLSFV